MRFRIAVVFVALVASLVVAGGSGPALASESVIELPVDRIADVLIDESHGHLYVSSATENAVLVLDLAGNLIETIGGVSGAGHMDLSPSAETLWVPASGSDEVIGYDTQTLDEVDRIAFAEGDGPISVADLGDVLAVGGIHHEPIRIVDIASHTITAAGGPTVYNGMVIHHDSWGDIVVVSTRGLSPFTLFELDTGAVTPEVVQVSFGPGGNMGDLAPNPDGEGFVTASGSPYVHQQWDLATYSVTLQYDSNNYPNSVAWSGDGSVLAGGTSPSGNDLYTFSKGTPSPFWTWNLQGGDLQARGLALNHDGSVVYAVTTDRATDVTLLHIIDVGTPVPGSIKGTIEHDFPAFNSGRADKGHVDLYVADTNEYLGTWDADGLGNYTIPSVDPGVYELVFWNGDEETIYDFFPELYREQPLYLDEKATPVTVGSGQTVTVNGHLRPLFFDMFDSVFIDDIYWMGNAGITKGCDPPANTMYCPDATVTRGQMAAFLVRAFALPAGDGSIDFVDDDGSIFEDNIERLAFAGITKGCNPPINDRFCPNDMVTRGQMAAFLVRAFGLPAGDGSIDFVDDDGSIFEDNIERLASAGITKGCNPPTNDRFCPNEAVTRGQMAAFLRRGFQYVLSFAQESTTDQDVVTSGGLADR